MHHEITHPAAAPDFYAAAAAFQTALAARLAGNKAAHAAALSRLAGVLAIVAEGAPPAAQDDVAAIVAEGERLAKKAIRTKSVMIAEAKNTKPSHQ